VGSLSRVSITDLKKMQTIISRAIEASAQAAMRTDNDLLLQVATPAEPIQAAAEASIDTPIQVVGGINRETSGENSVRQSSDSVVLDTQVNQGFVHGFSTPQDNGIMDQITSEAEEVESSQEAETPSKKEAAGEHDDILSKLNKIRPETNLEVTPNKSISLAPAEENWYAQEATQSEDDSESNVVENGDQSELLCSKFSGRKNLDWSVKQPSVASNDEDTLMSGVEEQDEDDESLNWNRGSVERHPLKPMDRLQYSKAS
jgi:hypothetical protein